MATLEGPALPSRAIAIQTAIGLEYFTIAYNILEGVVSVVLGGLASSVALIGFGLDSFVESFSGLVVLLRFRCEAQGQRDNTTLDSRALRYVGWSFFLLSTYIAVESIRKLWFQEPPDPSPLGIALAAVSLIVMPALAGDSKQTLACMLLSVALLLGLSLNAALGWWWADPIAGLAMVPWLLKEGQEALRGEVCCE